MVKMNTKRLNEQVYLLIEGCDHESEHYKDHLKNCKKCGKISYEYEGVLDYRPDYTHDLSLAIEFARFASLNIDWQMDPEKINNLLIYNNAAKIICRLAIEKLGEEPVE